LHILAIDTLQIAMHKEQIANPFGPGNWRLFALVQANGCNSRIRAGTTIS